MIRLGIVPVLLTHLPRILALSLFAYLAWPLLGKNAPLFHWHPFLMTISFAVLLPGALSFFQPSISLFSFLGFNVDYRSKVNGLLEIVQISFHKFDSLCGLSHFTRLRCVFIGLRWHLLLFLVRWVWQLYTTIRIWITNRILPHGTASWAFSRWLHLWLRLWVESSSCIPLQS